MLVSVEPLLEKFEFEDEIVGVDVVFEMCFNGEIFIGFFYKGVEFVLEFEFGGFGKGFIVVGREVEAVDVLVFEGVEVFEEFFEELVNVDFADFGALVNAEEVGYFFVSDHLVELLDVGHVLHEMMDELDELLLHNHQLNILPGPALVEFLIGD